MAQQAEKDKLKVFISYSRADLAFADQLDAALTATGFATTLDRHGISGGEEWQKRLGTLIAETDTVVFVVSPDSAVSKICAWEIGEAHKLAKRIIPVVCRPLGDVAAPEKLAALNYIFFYDEVKAPGSGFGVGLARLIQALNTDLDWLHDHTRYAQRAMEWEDGERDEDRLLSGSDIPLAKDWLTRRPHSAPEVLPLVREFILASEEAQLAKDNREAQRLKAVEAAQAEREKALATAEKATTEKAEASRRVVRRTVAGIIVSLALAAIASGAGFWAFSEKDKAEAERARAESALAIADRRADRLRLSMLEAFMEPTAVQEALDYIIESETTAFGQIENRQYAPYWPGLNSGVTIGIGYDLGFNRANAIQEDWGGLLPQETIARLTRASGLSGRHAQEALKDLQDIEIPFAAARKVFMEKAVPKYYRLTLTAFPGVAELPFACQAALLSVVYNRGASMKGDRRSEMRSIRDAIENDQFEEIPAHIRAMKRIWEGTGLEGLRKRREMEAQTCERAIQLRKKVQTLTAQPK